MSAPTAASKTKIFRWRGIGPLLLLLALLITLWVIFGDRIVQDTGEEAGSELLGTEVDLAGLHIRETDAALTLDRVQIANPFDSTRNLIETGGIVVDVEPAALLEKKLVIDQLTIGDVRFGTERDRPARPAAKSGFASNLLGQVAQWRQQFKVPALTLTTVDTIKQLALDPSQLGTVKEAKALAGSADSLLGSLRADVEALDPRPVIDSARALTERLAATNPATLGLLGLRNTVQSVRRTIAAVDSVKRRVSALQASGQAGLERLQRGVASLDQARQRDYDLARSLLQLPSFDAPHIGEALFGKVSIDRFQQVVYWSELAQKYLPPGLQPRRVSGPKRLREAGTTVLFPKVEEYPTFLLSQGKLSLALQVGGATHTLEASVAGLTTEPVLYGRPATFDATGTVGGTALRLAVNGLLDHTGQTVHDSVAATVVGIRLPAVSIPGLPFRVDPGVGTTGLAFSRRGDQISAQWTLRAAGATWSRDSATTLRADPVKTIVWEVVSGLSDLQVTAQLEGDIRKPALHVRSNLDDAVAARLRSLLGEAFAKAEARVKAEVDQRVAGPVADARAKLDSYRTEVTGRLDQVQGQLDQAKADLEARLKSLVPG